MRQKEQKQEKPNQNISSFEIHIPMSPTRVTEVYDSYWKFAVLRQDIFFNRINRKPFPWSKDPILNKFRFTNSYRAADRVSQYLIKNVIYNSDFPDAPEEVLFRILLFKLFNKIETWELLTERIGDLRWKNFKFNYYDDILTDALTHKKKIYSAAYIMPSGKSTFGYERKHSNHLKLIEYIIRRKTHLKLAQAETMSKAFEILKGLPGLGNFLAYQLLIDINYSEIIDFLESDFVVPGPGAKGGISKCFLDKGGLNNSEIIKFVTDRQELEFERLGLTFQTLWGRPLQLIDCQNLFCEVDKYARVKHPEIKGESDRTKIKQSYRANYKSINYWFPPKWGLNQIVEKYLAPDK